MQKGLPRTPVQKTLYCNRNKVRLKSFVYAISAVFFGFLRASGGFLHPQGRPLHVRRTNMKKTVFRKGSTQFCLSSGKIRLDKFYGRAMAASAGAAFAVEYRRTHVILTYFRPCRSGREDGSGREAAVRFVCLRGCRRSRFRRCTGLPIPQADRAFSGLR